MSILANRINKSILKERLRQESLKRKTVSFYRYVKIENPQALRDELFIIWSDLNCLGRIYIAQEGINAQMSIPEISWDAFVDSLNSRNVFKAIPFNHAVDGNGKSFYKLIIKLKTRIVSDGITDPDFDASKTGAYLNAEDFNTALNEPGTIVVDMRNHYESEVGRFEGAFCPDADTFREELPMVIKHLKGKESQKVLMYCTGGIRCEKASAYLRYKGFTSVYHLQGGIIKYAQEIRQKQLESKFKGLNFVFDERLGERITNDVISSCHQCGTACDTHVNCKNNDCHLLFIQCANCATTMEGCCTNTCKQIIHLPFEEQKKLRRGRVKNGPECLVVYKSRLRPKLKPK